MGKRILYIFLLGLIVPIVSFKTEAQQPSVYSVKRMTFNVNGFSNISPVIVKDGIIFCSNRRYSGISDHTGFDGRRLYNIYIAEKKDTTAKGVINSITDRYVLHPTGKQCILQVKLRRGKWPRIKILRIIAGSS